MSTGFPGAHQSWLSPCEKDPSHTKTTGTTGNPPVQKVHRKACNTAKGETKIQESEMCTSISITIFTVQLEQRCFRCFGVWELLWRKKIKETGAALCEYELVAESFYFSLFPKLGWTEFNKRNTPSTYGGSSQGDQHRTPQGHQEETTRDTTSSLQNFTKQRVDNSVITTCWTQQQRLRQAGRMQHLKGQELGL